MAAMVRPLLVALVPFALAACSSSPESVVSGAGGQGGGAPLGDVVIEGDRPVTVHVPPAAKAGAPLPLVVMLHGYSASGLLEELYLQLEPLSDARGFYYAHPDGLVDSQDHRYWNATDACCDFDHSAVDDSAYLSHLIDAIRDRVDVDPKRIYLIGHSNGGFMSYRMACDHADQLAAIASLAGATWLDASKCSPSGPVAVLEIHGTKDEEVLYDGVPGQYPGAVATVTEWAGRNGCGATADTSAPPLDLDAEQPGAETTVSRFPGCAPGGAAELWTIAGAGHIPGFTNRFAKDVVDFLFAHPKP
jgi:polyhydroxybutyrate depolymerase